MSTRAEARIGSIVAGLGLIWAAKVNTYNFTALPPAVLFPPGPLETSAIGILIWLHAKWRNSVKLR
ncbi:MAG TPA: hypothetical protein VFU76_10550 [Terriglobales bacterium]|nr:hypothetical protein [Terriglobales bacterium]